MENNKNTDNNKKNVLRRLALFLSVLAAILQMGVGGGFSESGERTGFGFSSA